jgi:hypothetical protein
MFQNGLQQYAIGSGIQEATKQVDALNQANMSELEKRQQQQKIAQQLTLKLTQAGATGTQIQSAYGAIAPPELKTPQDWAQAATQTGDTKMMEMANKMQDFSIRDNKALVDQQQDFQGSENEKNRNLQRELAGLKSDKKFNQTQLQVVKELGNRFEEKTQDSFKGYQLAGTAISLLNSDNPIADKAVLNNLVKASGDTGVITETDRAAFSGSQKWDDIIARLNARITTGKLNDQDRNDLMRLAELYKTRARAAVDFNADRFSKRAANLLGVPVDDVRPRIFPGWDQEDANAAAKPAAAGVPPALAPNPANVAMSAAGMGLKPTNTPGVFELPDGQFVKRK